MDTHYTEEQEAFRASLRRFLEGQAGTGFTRARWHEPVPVDAAQWKAMAELGITGLLVPSQYGGSGGDMTDMGVVMEELGRAVHPGPCWSSCVGATSAAVLFDCGDLLGGLADGNHRSTLALEEPGRGFPTWQQARLSVANGTLTGTKVAVPDARGADSFFVTTEDGVYLVAANSPGLRIVDSDWLDGSRRFAELHFDGVAGARLGDNAQLAATVDRMLVANCADALGAAQRALELTIAHASQRQQFGQHIGSFQAVQHLCADMLQTLELGRAGLHYALWAMDAAGPDEAHRAAVMCKAYVADTYPRLGANAIQVFGGAGFTWEYDIQLYYKRLLSAQMCWGTAEVWLEQLAELVIDGQAPPITPDL